MADIPEGLDDLLKSIRGETSSAKSSALAIVAKAKEKQEDDLVDEDIDPRILRMLGLEDVVDVDYDTYKTLLKEKMMAARMSGSEIPTEESELITNEFKRVKGKTGRFKAKKKINKDSFFGTATDVSTAPQKPLKALPAAVDREVEEQQEEQEETFDFLKEVLAPSLKSIEENLQSVLETLNKQLKLEKKEADKEDKQRQKTKRKSREAVLEGEGGSSNKIKDTAKKIMKPAMGIFDFIKNFILQTLLGGAAVGLLKFLEDPAGNFDKLWKGMVNGIIGLLNNVISFLYDSLIMPINTALNALNSGIEEMEKQINKALAIFGGKGITLPKIPLIPLAQIQPIPLAGEPPNEGGPITFTAPQMAGGGMVDGSGPQVSGMGADTQLVALAPGEVVMSNKAGDMFGRDTLLDMNAAAGGTNRPKMGKGNLLGFQGGGMLGRQGAAPTKDYGSGSGAGAKGYVIVPGHAAGGGAPGEMELTPALARNIVENLRARVGPNVPIKVMDMHSSTENTDAAFSAQQDKLKDLEKQGFEVIEIHMDASLESGYGTGKGVILPMPGTDAINPLEADFARTSGAFGREHRGGLAATNRGVSIIELGNMSPQLQQQVLKGGGLSKDQLDILTRPFEDSFVRSMGSPTSSSPPPVIQSTTPMAAGAKRKLTVPPPVAPKVTVVPAPTGPSPTSQPLSNSGANQSKVPGFSPVDAGNFEMMVVKSIYNIVG